MLNIWVSHCFILSHKGSTAALVRSLLSAPIKVDNLPDLRFAKGPNLAQKRAKF